MAAWDIPEAGRYAVKEARRGYLGVSVPPSGGMPVAQSTKRDSRPQFAGLPEIGDMAFY